MQRILPMAEQAVIKQENGSTKKKDGILHKKPENRNTTEKAGKIPTGTSLKEMDMSCRWAPSLVSSSNAGAMEQQLCRRSRYPRPQCSMASFCQQRVKEKARRSRRRRRREKKTKVVKDEGAFFFSLRRPACASTGTLDVHDRGLSRSRGTKSPF